ncbi:MAG: hypothetical protein ACYC5F_09820 [Thermoleophilia bacterium]
MAEFPRLIKADGSSNPLRGDADGNMLINPGLLTGGGTAVTHDSIDITKMTKGPIVQTHSALTAPNTSALKSGVGYNAIMICLNVTAYTSGTVYLSVSGNMDGSALLGGITDSRAVPMQVSRVAATCTIQTFVGVPDYFYMNAFGTFVATYSAYYQLLNV